MIHTKKKSIRHTPSEILTQLEKNYYEYCINTYSVISKLQKFHSGNKNPRVQSERVSKGRLCSIKKGLRHSNDSHSNYCSSVDMCQKLRIFINSFIAS